MPVYYPPCRVVRSPLRAAFAGSEDTSKLGSVQFSTSLCPKVSFSSADNIMWYYQKTNKNHMGQEASKEPYHKEKAEAENKKESVVLPFKRTNPMWSRHAKFMADTAGITISDKTVVEYAILRDEKTNPHCGMSDQQLLAEALRMSGDDDNLATFKKTLPHIFNKKN